MKEPKSEKAAPKATMQTMPPEEKEAWAGHEIPPEEKAAYERGGLPAPK